MVSWYDNSVYSMHELCALNDHWPPCLVAPIGFMAEINALKHMHDCPISHAIVSLTNIGSELTAFWNLPKNLR